MERARERKRKKYTKHWNDTTVAYLLHNTYKRNKITEWEQYPYYIVYANALYLCINNIGNKDDCMGCRCRCSEMKWMNGVTMSNILNGFLRSLARTEQEQEQE